jgi:hypothetical protein
MENKPEERKEKNEHDAVTMWGYYDLGALIGKFTGKGWGWIDHVALVGKGKI